jgi:hypothetical protein
MAAALALVIDGISAVLGVIVEALDATVGWTLGGAMAPVELLLAIPYAGRALGWLWHLILSTVWAVLAAPDMALAVLGVLPEKRLRVWLIVPESVSLAPEFWVKATRVAAEIFRREANVRLVPAQGLHWRRAFGPSDTLPEGAARVANVGTSMRAEVGCQLRAAAEDLGGFGSWLSLAATRHHLRGGFRRLTGWGAPLMVVAVNSVEDGTLAGCSLGPLTDYVTVSADQPVCLAHELGHACNLLHTQTGANLMNPTCGGAHLSRWQVAVLRVSRHVTYL